VLFGKSCWLIFQHRSSPDACDLLWQLSHCYFFNAESSGYNCVWFSVAVRMWLTVYVASTLPSVVFVLYSTVMAFGLFIPITGRIGSDKNPELIIGIFSALLCLLLISYMVSVS